MRFGARSPARVLLLLPIALHAACAREGDPGREGRDTAIEQARERESPLVRGRALVLFTTANRTGTARMKIRNRSSDPRSRLLVILGFADGAREETVLESAQEVEAGVGAPGSRARSLLRITAMELEAPEGRVSCARVSP